MLTASLSVRPAHIAVRLALWARVYALLAVSWLGLLSRADGVECCVHGIKTFVKERERDRN